MAKWARPAVFSRAPLGYLGTMRTGPMARSLVAATVMSLGAAAVPATAHAGLLSGILEPVVNLLDGSVAGSGTSGSGSAPDRLPDPPPPTAPAPAHEPRPTPAPAPGAVPCSIPGHDPGASRDPRFPRWLAPPAVPRSPVSLRYLIGRHLLSPAPGTLLGGLQPTLRWRGGPARVDLYNVQIFSATGQKVVSAFPRRRSFRVPAKRLAPGRRYVWRVWPYARGHGYTRKPLALSWFATPSRTVLADP